MLAYLGLHDVVLQIPVEVCCTEDCSIRSQSLVSGARLSVPAISELIIVVIVSLVDHGVNIHDLAARPLTHSQHLVTNLKHT